VKEGAMMNLSIHSKILGVLTSLFLWTGATFGQSAPNQVVPDNTTGIQPYNTYGGTHENISLATGDLNLEIPILTLPGRAGHDLQLSVIYDSKIWAAHLYTDPITGSETYSWDNQNPGPHWNTPVLYSTFRSVENTGKYWCNTDFVLQLADGSKHSFTHARMGCTYYAYLGAPGVPAPSWNVSQDDAQDATFIHLDTTNYSDVIATLK
jgi:hypothetical protein